VRKRICERKSSQELSFKISLKNAAKIGTKILTFALLLANSCQARASLYYVNDDCAEVDERIPEIAGYKNNYVDVAA
jgi:hypothetical protein